MRLRLLSALIALNLSSAAWSATTTSPDDQQPLVNLKESGPTKNEESQETPNLLKANRTPRAKRKNREKVEVQTGTHAVSEDDQRPDVRLRVNPPPAKKPVLQRITREGTYIYKTIPSPQKYAGGIRFGPFNPTKLQGTSGLAYSTIYGSSAPIMTSFDFEFQIFQKAGKLALKPSLGFFTGSGSGRFVSPQDAGLIADEGFTLFVFPLSASAVYRAQFWYKQILVPFGEVGTDYFAMAEYRNDQSKFQDAVKFGGGAAWHVAGGIQLQLDFLDRQGLWSLDADYGINHIYLTADMRQIVGLSAFDFSATMFEGGVLFEF